MNRNLSKSTFIRGLQCHKSLWLYKRKPELRDEPDAAQQARFAIGDDVGKLAQDLFPGGEEIVFDSNNFGGMLSRTGELIDNGMITIYEATFSFDNIFIMADILHKGSAGWELYEVKSSTDVKDVHINDLSIQYYVLSKFGIELSKISLVHINNQYTRTGEINPHMLFTIVDLTDDIRSNQSFVREEIQKMRLSINGKCPDINIGSHCNEPYYCDFKGHCWEHIPTPSIFDLRERGIDKFECYRNDIIHFKDLDLSLLNEKQKMQVEVELTGRSVINKDSVKEFLGTLFYPLYFLDFETFNPPIPPFDGTRPYKQIPFQYSLHFFEEESAELQHREFLAVAGTDPREELAKRLVEDIPAGACVIAYNKSFEQSVIRGLAEMLSRYRSRLMHIHDNIYDLMGPFRQRHYYTKEMKGSYSIKAILPVLVDNLSYTGLAISDGGMASATYASLHNINDEKEVKKIRNDLLEYCMLDTLATVKVLEILKNSI